MQYAFSGYAALSPLLVAALFWKRSTKWGALAVTLWVAAAVIYTARVPGALAWFGLLPVVPMTIISALLMIVVSLVTPPPVAEDAGALRVGDVAGVSTGAGTPEVRDTGSQKRSNGANGENGKDDLVAGAAVALQQRVSERDYSLSDHATSPAEAGATSNG